MSIKKSMADIEELFSIFDDPKDKLNQLMDIGKESEGIPKDKKIERTRIRGCASQAWIIGKKVENTYMFSSDSDALIVKGLLALLCKIFSGNEAKDIHLIDHNTILEATGLTGSISIQRTNGFANAVSKIHQISI